MMLKKDCDGFEIYHDCPMRNFRATSNLEDLHRTRLSWLLACLRMELRLFHLEKGFVLTTLSLESIFDDILKTHRLTIYGTTESLIVRFSASGELLQELIMIQFLRHMQLMSVLELTLLNTSLGKNS